MPLNDGHSALIELFSGGRFDLSCPSPDDVHLVDIAHALSQMCRFTGHSKHFYSVAEHSVHCSQWLGRETDSPQLEMLALIHDAGEAYMNDPSTPLKLVVPGLRDLDERIMRAVYAGLEIAPPTIDEQFQLKRADQAVLAAEVAVLMPSGGSWWNLPHEPADVIIKCLTPSAAENWFNAQAAHCGMVAA